MTVGTVVTRAQGFMTSSQSLSFISVHLSWFRRGNAGVHKAIDDSCFICTNTVVTGFMGLCLFPPAHFLDLSYTLYAH